MANLLDMVGAILISSLVLLALLGVMLFVRESEVNTTMDNLAQVTATNIALVIENDFRKIGYKVPSGQARIVAIDSNSITFRGDVDSSGTIDSIRYYLGSAVSSTSGTSWRTLYRVVNGVTQQGGRFGLTYFNLTAYDSLGVATTTGSRIRAILVRMNLLSKQANNGRYAGTYWQARFRPVNLTIN